MRGQRDEGSCGVLSGGGTKARTKDLVQVRKAEGLRQSTHVHHPREADNWWPESGGPKFPVRHAACSEPAAFDQFPMSA